MMSSRLIPVSLIGAMLMFLSACNGAGEKDTTDATASDSIATESVAPVTPASTIVTTPQGMLLVKHRVNNYAKWKASYDAHDSMRLANGIHNYVIGRGVEDSNMLFVATKVDDLAKAKAFSRDASLKAAMQKGGVLGKPVIQLVNVTWQDTSDVGAVPRSLTSFPVKDWDTWQKAFTEGRTERIENGVADRVFGNDADDPNNVTLVTALTDTAKAQAYWKSDQLKQRRAASGAIGMPERFLFRVVQRY